MTLDRSIPPATAPLTYRPLPPVEQHQLKNDLPVYTIQHGPMAVVEIAFHFYAGTAQAGKAGISGLVAKMLSEGTRHHTAEQLATKLDGHGAEIEAKGERNLLSVSLSTPTEAISEVLPLLAEVLFESAFPQPAYSLLMSRMAESLKVSTQRTKHHAQRAFLHKVFGPDNPLGMHLGPDELQAVGINDLRGHYRAFLTMNNGFVTVAGQFDTDELLKQLQQFFGGTHLLTDPPKPAPTLATRTAEAGRYDIHLPDKLQSTLRLGYPTIGRQHADYYALSLTTLILGGYFGSRLMTNIREEKGYTYGIHAMLNAPPQGGYLMIGTDVGNAYVDDTLSEIDNEINRLRDEPVSEKELMTAKNYLLGRLLSRQETPFQVAQIVRKYILHGFEMTKDRHTFESFARLDAVAIQSAAQQYLSTDRLVRVVAGS